MGLPTKPAKDLCKTVLEMETGKSAVFSLAANCFVGVLGGHKAERGTKRCKYKKKAPKVFGISP